MEKPTLMSLTLMRLTLMRGFKYKDKEGVEIFLGKSYVNVSFTLSGVTLTRGFTVCL